MAEVCEHCQGPVSRHEAIAVRDGYSYHMKCHKCCKFYYVCSELDLQNAELFKGVIFCKSCAQRIFQGCSTARHTKDPYSSRYSGRHDRTRRRRKSIDGIIELTTLATSSESSDQRNSCKAKSSTSSKNGHRKPVSTPRNMTKSSVEMGMTTEVTQELLRQMQCPVIDKRDSRPQGKPRKNRRRSKKAECSDLRIAELGASTEIANMALRNKSEQPVIIKSDTRIIRMSTKKKSTKESLSESGDQGTTDTPYSSEDSGNNRSWMDRRLGSLLRMPYRVFVKKVLQRSSLISIIMSSKNSHPDNMLLKRFKRVFHNEVIEHQNRGVRRLYSTINRKKIQNKMGWLEVSRSQVDRCKHFNNSHSYRCMRAQAMRLAGPTESELTGFRNKVMDFVSPGFFRRKLPPMLMSQACGNSVKS